MSHFVTGQLVILDLSYIIAVYDNADLNQCVAVVAVTV
jgi:hypothetical protein